MQTNQPKNLKFVIILDLTNQTNTTNKTSMRPYQNGKAPKTPGTATAGKRTHTKRGSKVSGEMNGVQKTLIKAKVTAVKARNRLRGAERDEVADLLETSVNVVARPTPKKGAAPKSDKKTQNRVMKSVASLKNLEQEFKRRTTRYSLKK